MVSLRNMVRSIFVLSLFASVATEAQAQSVAPACQPAFIAGMNYQKAYNEQQVLAIQNENQEMKGRLERLEKYLAALEGETTVKTAGAQTTTVVPIDRRDE